MNIWTSAILRTQIYVNVERKKLRVTVVTTNFLECNRYETGGEVIYEKKNLWNKRHHTQWHFNLSLLLDAKQDGEYKD